RDPGHVADELDIDAGLADAQPAVLVDREIAQGVSRRGNGRSDDRGDDHGQEDAHALHARTPSRPASWRAAGRSRTVRFGFTAKAWARSAAAWVDIPRSASTAARWYQSRASAVPRRTAARACGRAAPVSPACRRAHPSTSSA